MKMTFQLVDSSMAEELSDHDMSLFDNGFGPSQMRAEIDAGSCLITSIDMELAGYALTRQQGELVDITRLAILPNFRKQGCGRRLLRELLRLHDAPRYMLNVRKDNDVALELYMAEGFKIKGTVGDSWLMLKSTES